MPTKKSFNNPTMSDKGKNWNVVTGCDKYSDGCVNCYAEDVAEWCRGMGREPYLTHGFNLTMHYKKLDWPLKYLAKNPQRFPVPRILGQKKQ